MSTTEFETRALAMGWIPEEQFKGDKSKWVDAETFVKKGEDFLPIVKAENRKLKSQLDGALGKVAKLEGVVAEATESIKALQQYNTEMNQQRAQEMRKQIMAELKEARQAGDTDREAELDEKLDEVKDAIRTSQSKKTEDDSKGKPNGNAPAQPPAEVKAVFNEWLKDNSWWTTDRRMRAIAVDVTQEMLENGEVSQDMDPRERMDKVGARTKEIMKEMRGEQEDNQRGNGAARVEGARHSGGEGSGGGGNGVKGYAQLPPDAKAACERFSKQFVGENKLYKTVKDWQAKYASDYFANA